MSGVLDAAEQYAAAAKTVARLRFNGFSNAAIKSAIRNRQKKRAEMVQAIDTLRAQLEAAEAEVNRLRQENEALVHDSRSWERRVLDATGYVNGLEARAEADEADAVRYRWLRSQRTRADVIDRILYETVYGDDHPPYRAMKFGSELDAAIDAARTKEQQA